MSRRGRIEAIFLSTGAGQSVSAVGEADALPGTGLSGDRYHLGNGTYSTKPGPDRNVTLIAAEVLEELAGAGYAFEPGEHRRNLVTSGVDLNSLVGSEFQVGTVRLRGVRLCDPCAYLEELTGRAGLLKAMVEKGGLRAEILTGGTMRVGDAVG